MGLGHALEQSQQKIVEPLAGAALVNLYTARREGRCLGTV
jgi:hypothetical protein